MKLTDKDIERFNEKIGPLTSNGCRLWKACRTSNGYGAFQLNGKKLLAHRVAKFIEIGETKFNHDLNVNHRCKNQRDCVNPNCLYQGDHKDNAADRSRDGNTVHGSDCHTSKLTTADVLDILERLSKGETQQSIADEYNVNQTMISAISTGRSWKHVTLSPPK